MPSILDRLHLSTVFPKLSVYETFLLMSLTAVTTYSTANLIVKAKKVRNAISKRQLIDAAGNGDFNNVLRLLEKGAPTSYVCKHRGSSAIMIASKYGHIEIIRLLIQYGADIDAQNHQGQTSLMLASKYGHKECVQLLLEKGANPNIIDNNEYLD